VVVVATVGMGGVVVDSRAFERTVRNVGVVVFRAVSRHVALGATSETAPLGPILGAFLVSQFAERYSYICGIDVHWDVLIV
jgi:hypothetical protein